MPNDLMLRARISPKGHLDLLSRQEVTALLQVNSGPLARIFRNCSLAVLNHDEYQIDDDQALLERYPDYEVQVIQDERGIKLELRNAPAAAFVDGELIRGINEHLFSVLRDLVYIDSGTARQFDLKSSDGITNAVFRILRNARVLKAGLEPRLVVCWGGHSISCEEYDYSKEVGYQLGLRDMNICTGCGAGAMKGPMKGAAVAHAKQRNSCGQYLGITEPGIIASESPNPIVADLVIMPDIEKRLESFVRLGHAIIVFPGGAGTMEETLYILGVLLDPANARIPLPLVLTGPASAQDHFTLMDRFLTETLGPKVKNLYRIIIDDPEEVARYVVKGVREVRDYRRATEDAFYFNWHLRIPLDLQLPFAPTHENMRTLRLTKDRPVNELASDLRRAFSGIVSGNVKASGLKAIAEQGPFELQGDISIMKPMDELLAAFVAKQRMKLPSANRQYTPCYKLVGA